MVLAVKAQKKIPVAWAQLATKASLRPFCTRFCRITARLGPGDMAPMTPTLIRVSQEIKLIFAHYLNWLSRRTRLILPLEIDKRFIIFQCCEIITYLLAFGFSGNGLQGQVQ